MDGVAKQALIKDLTFVYGSDRASQIADLLVMRVKAMKLRVSQPQKPKPLTERDVLMIAYGDSFLAPDKTPLSALKGMIEDYLADMVSGVHILPFHPFSSDDGFSVMDYFKVNPALGDWDDIQAIAGVVDVMADAVVNHASAKGDWFSRYLADEQGFEDFFFEADPSDDLTQVVRPRTSPLLTPFEDKEGRTRHLWTTFSADQVDFDYRNSAVLVAVVDVLLNLVAKGARYLRLDAVTFLWKQAGSPSVHLPETHALIRIMRQVVLAYAPQTQLITETNVPHVENISYFGNGDDEAHMVYNFALPPLIAHSLISGSAEALSTWAATLDDVGGEACFFNFTASHDGVGLRASEGLLTDKDRAALIDRVEAAGGFVSYRALPDGSAAPYEMNCAYVDLICGGDQADDVAADQFVASQAIALVMPGVPALYVHSLFGSRNDHELAAETGRARSINRGQLDVVALKDELSDPTSFRRMVYDRLLHILKVRRKTTAFTPFATATVIDKGTGVFALRRSAPDGGDVLTLVNVSNRVQRVELGDAETGSDLLNHRRPCEGRIDLSPYQICWIACGL